jgi:leucyl-tRNA synthetase
VHAERWPIADPAMLTEERVTLIVQVNGKVRERIEISPAATTEECVAAALASLKVASQLQGREPQRVIARPPNLVNVVI